ncbi:ABC transporter substrate-binding protein [Salipaludibacillus sp. CF4.18]|uniref:ABC transporter substrate-binding protein n=1 Tax=Salipaludibacillus sp. CF4.18 TaxID=3373081 RepID=UPI003EE47FEB
MTGMIKKWGQGSLIFMGAVSMLVACGNNGNTNTEVEETTNEAAVDTEENENTAANNSNETTENNGANETADAEEFPVTVTDDAGNEVTIESEPESIVSLQPSNTEISFALGLGDKFVGVSEYDNYPPEVEDIEVVGAQDMDAELILSLAPDLALVTDYHFENHPEILEQYEEAGIDVLVIGGATSFEGAYDSMRLIGDATGTLEEAEAIIEDMEERLTALTEATSDIPEDERKKVWIEVAPSPDIFTTGTGTFMHEMLEAIHAVNAAEDQEGWVSLTEEEIVTLNPDVIVTTYGYYVEDPIAEVTSREGWDNVPAVANDEIYDVDSDAVTRPGPRLIEGVETLAEVIYPEVFE